MNGNINKSNDSLDILTNYQYNPISTSDKITSIIILTYNQLDCTKLCIESIRKFTSKANYEIIVVDNNSTDGTVDWLSNQSDIKVIFNSENKGFPAGCNQGINISNGDNILLLNNDTIVTPNWLNNLEAALYSNNNVGAVGAISNSCSNNQQINVSYNSISEMIEFSKAVNNPNQKNWIRKQRLIGYCFLVKKSVIDEVGLLDEIFTPGNFEDDDLSIRILLKDYKLLLCTNAFIHHFGSASFKNHDDKYLQIYLDNLEKFNIKWGFDINTRCVPRYDLINLIDEDINKSLNILHVDCGIGITLLEIKNKYINSNIYGIEKSTSMGKIASKLCNCTIGDIKEIEPPYEENYFDYIILGDILQYVINPEEILLKVKKYLKEDGYLLLSVTNLMHISIIKNILNGTFPYIDNGPLNKYTTRLYTLGEISRLLQVSNYNLDNLGCSKTNMSSDELSLMQELCSSINKELQIQYEAFQYIIKASNK